MSNGPGFEIKNCTQWPLTVSLDQVGPLYYDLVQPGDVFVRDTGAVWFTISAVVSADNRSHYSDWSVAWPIAAVVGAALYTGFTAGYGSFTFVGASLGARAFIAGGALPSLSTIVVGDALAAGGRSTLSVGSAAKLFGEAFAENGMTRRYGMYAGGPWPFNGDRKQYSVIGGPIASATPDGKLALDTGTSLAIVDHFQPIFNPPLAPPPWTVMPGTMKTMSMIRRGVMMGANDTGNMSVWDGSAWKRIPGVLRSMSAAADGTVWGVNGAPGQRDAQGRPVGNQVFRWKIGASNWEGPVAYDMNKVAVGAADQVWGIDTNRHVVVWDAANNRFKPPVMNTDAIDIAGASDGTLWYIGSDHFLYRVDPTAGTAFQPRMDGDFQLDRISIGGGRLIWGVRQGKVYRRERLAGVGNGTWSEVPVPEPFSEVTVSADGAVCGVAASEKIYTFSGT